MKTIIPVMGFIVLCCVSSYAQVDALDNSNPIENEEISSPKNTVGIVRLFPKMDEKVNSYRIVDVKTSGKTGLYLALTNDGDTIYKASYKRKKLKGDWVSYYANNQRCDSGKLNNNIPDGVWKSWHPNGQLRSIRTFNSDKLTSLKNNLLRYNPKTNLDPIINLEKSRPGSFGKNTNAYQAFIKYVSRDVLNMSASMSVNEKVYVNRLDQMYYLPPFSECFQEGLYMDFNASGIAADSGYYKSGLRDGAWVERIYDGNILGRGAYHHGHKTGTWSFYDRNGKLVGLKQFNKKGEQVSAKYYK